MFEILDSGYGISLSTKYYSNNLFSGELSRRDNKDETCAFFEFVKTANDPCGLWRKKQLSLPKRENDSAGQFWCAVHCSP